MDKEQDLKIQNVLWDAKNHESLSSVNFVGSRLHKALILAGGFGTRMKELTRHTPKPMLLLRGKPILEYSIDLCKRYGITDIAISIYYFGDKIKEYFGDGNKFGVNILYVEEKEPLGTGGALKLFRKWLNEPFMMCNADELKDINLSDMYDAHRKSNALATIALTKVDDPSQYGVVDLLDNRIVRFVEKPKKEEAPSNFINAGLYIIDPDAIHFVPEGFTMVEKDLFPYLAKKGRLNGYKFSGQWFDTGTEERYAITEQNWAGFQELPITEKNNKSAMFTEAFELKTNT
jgi:NDP-sugar pyrophosphorylase family protein